MTNYFLFDLANFPKSYLPLLDQSYNIWEQTYTSILSASGEQVNPDDFWRAKILAVIERDNEVLGLHLYNSFDLSCPSSLKHSYFKYLSSEKTQEIRQKNINKLMTCEFLTVNPKYRGNKKEGISWGEVIVGLCSRVFIQSPWDGLIGISRMDFKVDKMSMSVGALSIGEVSRHKVDCKIIIATRNELKEHVNPSTEEIISTLWNQVQNHTPWINTKTNVRTLKEVA